MKNPSTRGSIYQTRLGVGTGTVARFQKVQKFGDAELKQKVSSGQMPIKTGYKQIQAKEREARGEQLEIEEAKRFEERQKARQAEIQREYEEEYRRKQALKEREEQIEREAREAAQKQFEEDQRKEREAKKAARLAEIERQREEIAREAEKPTGLHSGLYDVISVDPPWPYETNTQTMDLRPGGAARCEPVPGNEYRADNGEQLPLSENAVVWLWTTHRFCPTRLILQRPGALPIGRRWLG